MFLAFLAFGVISLSLLRLGALIVWVEVLTSIVKLAMLVIGLLTLSLLWLALRRHR